MSYQIYMFVKSNQTPCCIFYKEKYILLKPLMNYVYDEYEYFLSYIYARVVFKLVK